MADGDEVVVDGVPEEESGRPSDYEGWIMLIASVMARHGRLAVNKTEAAEMLGVSVEFFDQHIADEVHCVRRGRRVIFPVYELWSWLCRASVPHET